MNALNITEYRKYIKFVSVDKYETNVFLKEDCDIFIIKFFQNLNSQQFYFNFENIDNLYVLFNNATRISKDIPDLNNITNENKFNFFYYEKCNDEKLIKIVIKHDLTKHIDNLGVRQLKITNIIE
jgi:hypothetical protein